MGQIGKMIGIKSPYDKEFEEFILTLGVTMDKYDVGLSEEMGKDWRYILLDKQLDALRPMPTTPINDAVKVYLPYPQRRPLGLKVIKFIANNQKAGYHLPDYS